MKTILNNEFSKHFFILNNYILIRVDLNQDIEIIPNIVKSFVN